MDKCNMMQVNNNFSLVLSLQRTCLKLCELAENLHFHLQQLLRELLSQQLQYLITFFKTKLKTRLFSAFSPQHAVQ